MQLIQPNVVGNFLQSYSAAQDQKRQQEETQYNRQRQMRLDDRADQQFSLDMDARQLDMALKRASAMENILSGVDERDPQTLEVAKQRYITTFGGSPQDVAGITIADIPRIKMQTGALAQQLETQLLQAQIGTEQAQGRAANALAAQRSAAAAGSSGGNVAGPAAAGATIATPQLPLRPLSAREQDAVLKNDETVNNAKSALVSIDEALKISPKAAAGFGTETLAPIMNTFEERARNLGLTTSTRASDTVQFDAIVKENILPQLKLIFGGNPTEGEREILLSIAGSSSMGYEARQRLLQRMRNAVQRRLSSAESTSNALRNRTYFLPQQYQPSAAPDQQMAPVAAPPAAAQRPAPVPAPRQVPRVPPPPGFQVIE